MEKKSSGGGQGSGGGKPPAKPAAPRTEHAFESASAGKNPRTTLSGIAAVVLPGGKGAAPAVDPKKHLEANVFSSGSAVSQRKAMLPSVWSGSSQGAGDEKSGKSFDGITPAEEVTSRDLWKAIQPPVSSREGARSAQVYEQVINQFAVGHNPRYTPDAPDKPRAHIFVWDVSRAMGTEIPHMIGSRELSVIQTLDWLRYEGSQRGWVKVLPATALDGVNEGKPVVVTPKQGASKVSLLAVMRPGVFGMGGHPRVAAAAKGRGNDLLATDALGVFAFEYFMHP